MRGPVELFRWFWSLGPLQCCRSRIIQLREGSALGKACLTKCLAEQQNDACAGMTVIMEEFREEFGRHCMCSAVGGPKYLNNLNAAPPLLKSPTPNRDLKVCMIPSLVSFLDAFCEWTMRESCRGRIFYRVGRGSTPGRLARYTVQFPRAVIRHQGEVTADAVKINARPPLPSTKVIASSARARVHGWPPSESPICCFLHSTRAHIVSIGYLHFLRQPPKRLPARNATHRWKTVPELWRLWLRRYPDTPTRQQLVELSMSLFIQQT